MTSEASPAALRSDRLECSSGASSALHGRCPSARSPKMPSATDTAACQIAESTDHRAIASDQHITRHGPEKFKPSVERSLLRCFSIRSRGMLQRSKLRLPFDQIAWNAPAEQAPLPFDQIAWNAPAEQAPLYRAGSWRQRKVVAISAPGMWILTQTPSQSTSHRIPEDVARLRQQILVTAHLPVVEPWLPECTACSARDIDVTRSLRLQSLHHAAQALGPQFEQPVHVIRHDDPGNGVAIAGRIRPTQFRSHRLRGDRIGEEGTTQKRHRRHRVDSADHRVPSNV